MKYLIVNPGSASKKYAFYENHRELFRAHLEREGDGFLANLTIGKMKGKISITEAEFKNPHRHIFDILLANKFIDKKDDINAVGVRIVAPGDYFAEHKPISGKYVKNLKAAEEVAPLHVGPVLNEIYDLQKSLPDARLLGISDSAFHKNRPAESRVYGIRRDDAEKYGIYRYSYHGISLESILEKLEDGDKKLPSRIIICHLGGGASVSAIKDGKSLDSTMGFSPLEGLIMATRVGDMDAGALIYMAKKLDLTLDELEEYLNHQCGLLGISGKSSDIRQLLEMEENGDENAALALNTYAYKIKKYIGAYTAALNGLDLLVFSGTVGERSSIMRERICKDLECMGIDIDKTKNHATEDGEGYINESGSKVKVAVVKTEEVAEIAREVKKLL
jgi:acetate kinase